jgi:hypothetical protein
VARASDSKTIQDGQARSELVKGSVGSDERFLNQVLIISTVTFVRPQKRGGTSTANITVVCFDANDNKTDVRYIM